MDYILETYRWPQKGRAAEDCLADGHQWRHYGIEASPVCGHCGAVLESVRPLPIKEAHGRLPVRRDHGGSATTHC